ncbi:MAG: hypothetical protein J7J06_00955 [Methanosarcinales archaeon]|nr:hypothetical protein [Methanosarcinales archaeon]
MQWREKQLLDILKNGTLKTGDVIDRANMSKTTALKYLESLRARGHIGCKMIGPTKLWYCMEEEKKVDEGGGAREMVRAELKKYIYIDKRVFEILEEFEDDAGIELNILVDKDGMRLIFTEG